MPEAPLPKSPNMGLFKDRLDLIREGMQRLSPKVKQHPKLDFVPVIFANGVDCDVNGIRAAIDGERVMVGETIFEQGQDIMLVQCNHGMRADVLISHDDPHNGRVAISFEALLQSAPELVINNRSRTIIFDRCKIVKLMGVRA